MLRPITWNQEAYEAALAKRATTNHRRVVGSCKRIGEDIRRVRVAKILDLMVQGLTKMDIAKTVGLSPTTVDREVAWARKQGLVRGLETQVLDETIPEAIRQVNLVLQDAKASVSAKLKAADMALKLFKVFSEQSAAKDLQPQKADADPLDAYWQQLRAKAIDITTLSQQALPAPSEPDVPDPNDPRPLVNVFAREDAGGAGDPGHTAAAVPAGPADPDEGPAAGEPPAGDSPADCPAGGSAESPDHPDLETPA